MGVGRAPAVRRRRERRGWGGVRWRRRRTRRRF
uniref:Uncharacterized protein n=1 Tax=Arundo donax TaxID=35708 RepID=A0A0A9ESG7_ARUDO